MIVVDANVAVHFAWTIGKPHEHSVKLSPHRDRRAIQ